MNKRYLTMFKRSPTTNNKGILPKIFSIVLPILFVFFAANARAPCPLRASPAAAIPPDAYPLRGIGSGFRPMLLKVEASTDQLQPGETAWLTCWWQNVGDAPSPKPLTLFLETGLGHQRILETLPRWQRSYTDPYPSTNYWRPGEIWKTTIKMSPPSWGGTYHLSIGLCDEDHLPVAITGPGGLPAMQATVGEIDVTWGWGQPTVVKTRKAKTFELNAPLLVNPSPGSIASRGDTASSTGEITIGSSPAIRLADNLPAVLSLGHLRNSPSIRERAPWILLRKYATDRILYSSESNIRVTYKGRLKGDTFYSYSAKVMAGNDTLAGFVLNYRSAGKQLRITLDSVEEKSGYELLEIHLPAIMSLSGKGTSLVDFFDGGRQVSLEVSAPMGFTHLYDTRNAAALITAAGQVALESSCLDDRLITAICEKEKERTAELGMVMVHRVRAKGKIRSILVEDDHSIILEIPGQEWGTPSWQSLAKYWRRNLTIGNTALYRNALVYKILVTEGPQPPPEMMTDEAPYGVKRLATVKKFRDIPGKMRELNNVLDGMPQVLYIGGFEEGGFDNSYPYVFNTDQRAGTIQELKDCITEGKKYNAIVGLHDNYDDISPTKYYDPRIACIDDEGQPWKGWIWAGGQTHIVSPYKYTRSGLMALRVKKTIDLYGLHTTDHLDVLSSEPLRYDFDSSCPASAGRSLQGKLAIIDEFNKYGIDITSETLTHPFVGHLGYCLWTRDDRNSSLFKNEVYIPLIHMVYHGAIAYGGASGSDSEMLWSFIRGNNYFPSESFVTDKDIANIYLQQIPIRLFYNKKMDSISGGQDSMKVVYDPKSYVKVDFRHAHYEIVCDGQLVAKDWTTFAPGFKAGTWLAFSRKGGHFDYPLPALFKDSKRLKATILSRQGEGRQLPCRIVNGHIRLEIPAGVPVRISGFKPVSGTSLSASRVNDSSSASSIGISPVARINGSLPACMDSSHPVAVIHDLEYGLTRDNKGGSLSLRLDVYQPLGTNNRHRPVILLIHGGGFGAGDKKQDLYGKMASRFATHGYLAFSINYRLKSPEAPCGPPVLDSAVADASTALRWIKDHAVEFGADTTAIIVCGDSAGGAIAVNMSFDNVGNGSLAGCIDLWGGMCDPADPAFTHRPPWDQPIYPKTVAARTPPACIIHGTAETVVPLSTSEDLSAKLTAAGIYNELHLLPGADHYPEQMAEIFIPWMIAFSDKVVAGNFH